jgi:hypothetical protein
MLARVFAAALVLVAVGCFSVGESSSSSSGCSTPHYNCDFGRASCVGWCDTNVTADSKNCGACGNACTESSCALGSCYPVRELAKGLTSPRFVAAARGTVYFVTESGDASAASSIHRVTPDGVDTTIAAAFVESFAASGAGVFWIEVAASDVPSLRGVRAGETGAVTLASPLGSEATSLVVDETTAAWLGSDTTDPHAPVRGSALWTLPLSGGSPTILTTTSSPPAIAPALAQSGDVYVYLDGLRDVVAVSKSGGTPVHLGTESQLLIEAVVADEDYAYWYAVMICFGSKEECDADGGTHAARRAPLRGGDVVDVPIADRPLVARWGEIYAIRASALVRENALTGDRLVIAGGLGTIEGLALDGASVYWLARGASANDGRLMAAAR